MSQYINLGSEKIIETFVLFFAIVVPVHMEEPLKAECRHFLECIESKRQPRTDGEEGLRVLKIIEASRASLDDNGCNIHIGSYLKKEMETTPSDISDGIGKDCFIHKSAYLDTDVEIGESTKTGIFATS